MCRCICRDAGKSVDESYGSWKEAFQLRAGFAADASVSPPRWQKGGDVEGRLEWEHDVGGGSADATLLA